MLYPLKFYPILKETPWGGMRLLAKSTPSPGLPRRIGESWEISAVAGHVSIVSEGPLAGCDLRGLIDEHAGALVGRSIHERFGAEFPLLIKYIDAREDLSVQVHPDDDTARRRHGTRGKTEMWYVAGADEGASLLLGFERPTSREEFLEHLREKRLGEITRVERARAGECFFIPAGVLHAIGAGCFIVEIQETSDITYRVDAHDRRDASGKPRELHVALAAGVINYGEPPACRVTYAARANEVTQLVTCSWFTTNVLPVDRVVERDRPGVDSFTIYTCVEGNVTLHAGMTTHVGTGETVLVPAIIDHLTLVPGGEGTARLLEVFIEGKDRLA